MHDHEQPAQIERTEKAIGNAVLEFCRQRWFNGAPTFHSDDLRSYLAAEKVRCAPGSPDRILRYLRRQGIVQYRVLSRAKSLYELTEVALVLTPNLERRL